MHACDKDLNEVIRRLQHNSYLAIEWFGNNYMKLNTDKYNVHVASHKFEYMWRDIANNRICESNSEKMLLILTSNSLKLCC